MGSINTPIKTQTNVIYTCYEGECGLGINGVGRELSWLSHGVGDAGDWDTNPITAIASNCAAIHFLTVHNLQ